MRVSPKDPPSPQSPRTGPLVDSRSTNTLPTNVEEIGELEEVSEAIPAKQGREKPPRALAKLLAETNITAWTGNYRKSPLPIILLDTDLHIFWANLKFNMLYGDARNYLGLSLTRCFSASFTEPKKASLWKYIKNPKAVYSWRGQVEKKGKDGLTILANLLILPIFTSPQILTDPLAYAVILDDVTRERRKLLRGTFTSLLEASRLKDNDTGNHIQRVNEFSKRIVDEMMGHPDYLEVDREFSDTISFLASMHDVGKIGTSDNILNKQGPLDDWEWEVMKEHTINGAFILSTYPNPMAREIALFHHERWNGNGYPYGVSGSMIPLSARIVAIADVYDALRMKRSYKDAFSHEKAIDIMLSEEEGHFDPALRDFFVAVQADFDAIREKLKD